MLKHQQHQYEMFLRVRDFGGQHQKEFPATSAAGQAFATVTETAATIEQQSTERLVAAQAGKKAKAAARHALWLQLKAIVRSARSADEAEPPARDVFRLPARRSDQRLLDVAHAFLVEGEAASPRWVAFGLPETSISNLRAAVDAFAQAIDGRRKGQTGLDTAHKAMTQAFQRGARAVRHLDVIVANTQAPDSAIAAAWKTARHVAPRIVAKPADPAGLPKAS